MTKRQICIKTWYGTENYGSNLQAIGLSETLKDIGYDVYFLKKFAVLPFMLEHPQMLVARARNYINRGKSRAFFVPEPYKISEARKERLRQFSKTYFKEKVYEDSKTWKADVGNRVIFVAGSDILWNPAKGYPATAFLDFAYYAKLDRFSYASSIGALELPEAFYNAYRRYLGSMKEIGVREQSIVSMLEPIINRRPTKVVDPTLLRSREYWKDFSEKADLSVNVRKGGFVLAYFVMKDSRYWEYMQKVSSETGLQIIVLPMHSMDEQQPFDIVYDGTPYEFAWLIRNAEFVCTDSFHACVLSMIFHKEFYLLRRTRKAEDAKYDDFLGRYHLRSRSVTDESRFVSLPATDYGPAEEQLALDRKDSIDFLHRALEECK